jgi:hypothetical protein
MITALISTVLGMLGGAVPEIIKEVRDTRNHSREIEFLRLQNQLQIEREKAGADAKMREAEASLAAEEFRAMREHMTAIIEAQARPTGIRWIDGLNAVIRPATAAMMMLLFAWTASVFVDGTMAQFKAGTIEGMRAAEMIWSSLIGEAILATLGYLFGYRTTARRGVT